MILSYLVAILRFPRIVILKNMPCSKAFDLYLAARRELGSELPKFISYFDCGKHGRAGEISESNHRRRCWRNSAQGEIDEMGMPPTRSCCRLSD